jgi:hypothetical protein
MFSSRWVFSMTLAASGVEPEVMFKRVMRRWSRSPGLMRYGL